MTILVFMHKKLCPLSTGVTLTIKSFKVNVTKTKEIVINFRKQTKIFDFTGMKIDVVRVNRFKD